MEDTRGLVRRQQEWYARREGIHWGITRQSEDVAIVSCGLFRFDAATSREGQCPLSRIQLHYAVSASAPARCQPFAAKIASVC